MTPFQGVDGIIFYHQLSLEVLSSPCLLLEVAISAHPVSCSWAQAAASSPFSSAVNCHSSSWYWECPC